MLPKSFIDATIFHQQHAHLYRVNRMFIQFNKHINHLINHQVL